MTNNEYISEERPEDQEPQEETENDTTGSEPEPEFKKEVPDETSEGIGDEEEVEEEEVSDEEEAETDEVEDSESDDEYEEEVSEEEVPAEEEEIEADEVNDSESDDVDEEEASEEEDSAEEEEAETDEVEDSESDDVDEEEASEEEDSAEEEEADEDDSESDDEGEEEVSEDETLGINLAGIGDLITEANQLLDEVSTLRSSIGDVQVEHKEGRSDLSDYQNKMRTWKNKGYNVTGLESVIQTGIEDLAKRVFTSFERDVKRLKEVEKSLDTLDTTGFKKKESDIRDNLKDPEMIIPTLKHLIELEIDIRRKMEMDV